VVLTLAILTLISAEPGQQDVPAVNLITQPQWVALPSGDNLARAYPRRALRDGLGGRGVVTCRVTAKGKLEACVVVEESSPGFGQAALKAAAYYRMKPTTPDGKSVEGGTIRIPLVWRHPNDAPVRYAPVRYAPVR